MQPSTLLIFAALLTGAAQVHAQTLPDTITSADKALPVVNQDEECAYCGTGAFACQAG